MSHINTSHVNGEVCLSCQWQGTLVLVHIALCMFSKDPKVNTCAVGVVVCDRGSFGSLRGTKDKGILSNISS